MPQNIDIFVSYKREERAIADQVSQALIEAGYTTVTDRNIAKGEEFSDAIDKMIRSARLTLVLWTEASCASDWVKKEARLARDLQKAGYPNKYLGAFLEDIDIKLAADLRGLQMVDLANGAVNPTNLKKLLKSVKHEIGTAGAQTPLAALQESQGINEDLKLFEYACSVDVKTGYELYLKGFPTGQFVDEAKAKLKTLRRWYLHPFRRGNGQNTIAAFGVVIAAGGLWWTISQPSVEPGNTYYNEFVAAEKARDRALADLKKAEAETAGFKNDFIAATFQRDNLSTSVKRLEASLEKAKADERKATSALASKAKSDKASQAALTLAKSELTKAQADLKEQSRLLALAEAKLAKADKLEQQLRAEAAKHSSDPDCTTDKGQPGYSIQDQCIWAKTTELTLSNKSDEDFEKIGRLVELKVLELRNSGVQSIAFVKPLKKLNKLDISFTSVADLRAASGLSKLKNLTLSNSKVADLSPLKALPQLIYFFAAGTQITDISSLRSLTTLGAINLNDTKIQDFTSLENLPNLTTVIFPNGDFPQTRKDVLAGLEKRRK